MAKKIEEELKPPRSVVTGGSDKLTLPAGMQTFERKKYSLAGNTKNELEFQRLRNQVLLKKKIRTGEQIEVIDSDEEFRKEFDKQAVIDLDSENIEVEE